MWKANEMEKKCDQSLDFVLANLFSYPYGVTVRHHLAMTSKLEEANQPTTYVLIDTKAMIVRTRRKIIGII